MFSLVLLFCFFICAASNETTPSLTSQATLWTPLSGSWLFRDGTISSDWYESEIIVMDSMWLNLYDRDTPSFIISYTFAITFSDLYSYPTNRAYGSGYSGLAIYNARTLSSCDYYFIGINKLNSGEYTLALFWTEQQQRVRLTNTIVDSFTENIPHTLSVAITYPDDIVITIDGVERIHYVHSTRSVDIWPAGLTGYISLWDDQWVRTIAHALVISGVQYPVEPILNITNCKTLNPTFAPTINTHTPTVSPTKIPTQFTQTPTFTATIIYSTTTAIDSDSDSVDTETTVAVTETPLSDDANTQELYTLLLVFGVIVLVVVIGIMLVLCRSIGTLLRKRHLWKVQNNREPQNSVAPVIASDVAVLDHDEHRFVSASTSKLSMREYDDDDDDDKYEQERDPSISLPLKQWLRYKVRLPHYYAHFLRNGYETLHAVCDIGHDFELRKIGIEAVADRHKILTEIRTLNSKRASESFKTMNSSAAQFMLAAPVKPPERVAKLSIIEGGRDKYNECIEREKLEDSSCSSSSGSSSDDLMMVIEQHALSYTHTNTLANAGEKKDEIVPSNVPIGDKEGSSDSDDSLALPGSGALAQRSIPTSTHKNDNDNDNDDDLYGDVGSSNNQPTPALYDDDDNGHILIPKDASV